MRKPTGSLSIVGTGFGIAAQVTPEAIGCIQTADRVFCQVDTITEEWLRRLNAKVESLFDCYAAGRNRLDTYHEMADRMIAPLREGEQVCGAFYGHPGVFAYPTHLAVRMARQMGCPARMLPGISAEDCLYADLGIDPSHGCQSLEASDFLIRKRRIDTSCGLLLWQAALIGIPTYYPKHEIWSRRGLRVLVDVLKRLYSPKHRVILYEAASFPGHLPIVREYSLPALSRARITTASTLYIPPLAPAPVNKRMMRELQVR